MNPSNDKYQTRARIGVSASVGIVIGAIAAKLIFHTDAAVLAGSLAGALLGGVIGSRLRSQVFQYIWFEYSPQVGIRLAVSSVFFVGFMLTYFYVSASSGSTALQVALLAGTLLGMFFQGWALKSAISELDDMLKGVLKDSVVIGALTAIILFFILGLVNLILPIPSNWLLSFLVMMFAMLIGRLAAGWRYR
jgi:hypothetical protein